MTSLQSRIEEKVKNISGMVYHRGLEITLDSSRVVTLDSLVQQVTYAGVLEGWPNRSRNDRIISRLIQENADTVGLPSVLEPVRNIIPIETDEIEYFGKTSCPQPELLPHISCIGSFYSDKPARCDDELISSALTIIWFQDDWAMPISPAAMTQIKSIDWEKYAVEWEE